MTRYNYNQLPCKSIIIGVKERGWGRQRVLPNLSVSKNQLSVFQHDQLTYSVKNLGLFLKGSVFTRVFVHECNHYQVVPGVR